MRILIATVLDGFAVLNLMWFAAALAAFGLWRAGLISNRLFAVGVAAVVLVLLGGTTWLSGGFWAPDGIYSRFVSPLTCVLWVLVLSRVLLTRSPTTHAAW